jgi:rhodanese-related sulfurtransferase
VRRGAGQTNLKESCHETLRPCRGPRRTPVAALAALAITDAEYTVIQKAANQYLQAIPERQLHVSAEDVYKRIQSGKNDFVIVDVRVPKDKKFDQGHLPGAIFIASDQFARPENLAKLPKDKDIIVHCDTGQVQNKILTVLHMLGYDKAYAMKMGLHVVSGAADLTPRRNNASITKNHRSRTSPPMDQATSRCSVARRQAAAGPLLSPGASGSDGHGGRGNWRATSASRPRTCRST